MSTLNLTFGTRGRGAEAGAGARDRDGDRPGSGDETGAGTGEVTAAGAGAGAGTGARQQIIWRIPMARFEKTGQGVDTLESGACIIHTVQTSADRYYYTWRGMPFHFIH